MNTRKRQYEDACAGAHALDLIGERWALLVIRELVFGPKRFTDLRKGLLGISPNVLTQRLNELEKTSIIQQRKLPPPANVWVYELTEWGKELENIIIDLGRWGVRSPTKPLERAISTDSLVMSFKAMFNLERVGQLAAKYNFLFDNEPFHVEVGNSQIQVGRGLTDNPDVTVETNHNVLAFLVYGGGSLDNALDEKQLTLSGDKALFETFLTLFPLPEPAPNTYTPDKKP